MTSIFEEIFKASPEQNHKTFRDHIPRGIPDDRVELIMAAYERNSMHLAMFLVDRFGMNYTHEMVTENLRSMGEQFAILVKEKTMRDDFEASR